MMQRTPIVMAVAGQRPIVLSYLVLDFTGTLSKNGRLLAGVATRVRKLARNLRIVVATADTFGRVRLALKGLPVQLHIIRTGHDKLRLVKQLGPSHVIAIGNGRNDAAMLEAAAIGVAVIGPEGAAAKAVAAADVVVSDVRDALDMLTNPLRLTATLRP